MATGHPVRKLEVLAVLRLQKLHNRLLRNKRTNACLPTADVYGFENSERRQGRVLVMTSDGRCYVGMLKACDQATNLVLDQAVERIYSTDEGVKVQPVGLYVVRGDHVKGTAYAWALSTSGIDGVPRDKHYSASIGEIDNDLDNNIDLERIKAEPLKPF